jgi:hypothetical protein
VRVEIKVGWSVREGIMEDLDLKEWARYWLTKRREEVYLAKRTKYRRNKEK